MSSAVGNVDISPMSQADAEAIADWHYPAPYDFYDMRSDSSDLAELLDETRRADRYYSAHRAGSELVGFFEFEHEKDVVVVGLGLRPDLTGRGLGGAFVAEGMAFARSQFAPARFRLSVAEFNARAIRVYERAGFARTRSYPHETNGGVFKFVELERPA